MGLRPGLWRQWTAPTASASSGTAADNQASIFHSLGAGPIEMVQEVSTAARADRPRSAFSVLSWHINLAVVLALIILSVLAWQSTVEQAISMRGMAMGLGQIGGRSQGEMSATV